jgi:dipeptidyl aminopeptidase/acylaminoacyl peptidase
MTVSAPPRPTRTAEPVRHDPLEALIEEARRRARRRRQRNVATVLAAGAATAGVLFSFVQRGGAGHGAVPTQPRPSQIAVGARALANGPLTLADVESTALGEGPPGWYGLSTVGADGRLHVIARCPDAVDWCGEIESVAWSPDGASLALGVSSVGNANPYNGLRVVNPDTGEDRAIRSCRRGECDWFDIAWSPEGSMLAFVTNGDIALVQRDGSGHRVLVADPSARARSPSWSPDGRWLAFTERSNDQSAVYLIRSDGSDRGLLVDHASAPAWSPSGASVAYRRNCGIGLVTPDGADVTPPAMSGCEAISITSGPVWSPDGTTIALAGTTTYGTGAPTRGTWVMNADGTGLARVTPKTQGVFMGLDVHPVWRPVPAGR